MRREPALASARAHFDGGDFTRDLARRVAMRTDSQDPAAGLRLRSWLADELLPALLTLGFEGQVHDDPVAGASALLVATRHEDDTLPTVLMYGHGDVIRSQDQA